MSIMASWRLGPSKTLLTGLFGVWLFSILVLPALAEPSSAEENRLSSVSVQQANGSPQVVITAEGPIGYRYTVYDSQSPRRIIVDFRGMDVSAVKESIPSSVAPVEGLKVSSFDLTSGKLGRVEILISEEREYDVSLDERILAIALKPVSGGSAPKAAVAQPDKPQETIAETIAPEQAVAVPVKVAAPKVEAEISKPAKASKGGKASVINAVAVEGTSATFVADGRVEDVKYFTLTGPARLVVDLYGVRPAFKERSFTAGDGFGKIRVGVYKDKSRFVFDAVTATVPEFTVDQKEGKVAVSWGTSGEPPAQTRSAGSSGPAAVKAIDFYLENGNSVFAVTFEGTPELIKPAAEGDLVRFGIRNATISRRLRRVIDASAFPSAVRLITPYTVQQKVGQDVQFAAELKGPVPYDLKREGDRVLFVVENGPFIEAAPADVELAEVAIPPSAARVSGGPSPTSSASAQDVVTSTAKTVAKVPESSASPTRKVAAPVGVSGYSGQRISLVFDNADIRNILQLIADVSQLNLIATDEVQGNLSLRLIDVPWDQALDIVLDIKGLGKIQTDNVLRILPKEKIREMEKADLDAVKTRRDLEPVVTKVIPVSYSDLGSISAPIKELLSERGKITEDARNKQLIVTDVPSVLEEVRRLVTILDTPEKQVMIEARIVEANSNFARDLGVKWGISYDRVSPGEGDLSSANLGLGGSFLLSPSSVAGSSGAAGLGSALTFGRVGLDSTIIDLRISALETSGNGKVISTPRVTTLNGKSALISQGTKIPYQSTQDGATTTQFESAELKLDVKPVINPDSTIILDINVSNSSQGSVVPTGSGSAPAIDDKKAQTTALVKDGETTVIGGIFVETEARSKTGVPILMHIPILGHLFKSNTTTNERRELLIFITPRIVSN